jgi:hypothetical protein
VTNLIIPVLMCSPGNDRPLSHVFSVRPGARLLLPLCMLLRGSREGGFWGCTQQGPPFPYPWWHCVAASERARQRGSDEAHEAMCASLSGVVTAKLCILAIGALHPDSALSSDTQRADFLQKTYFVESPSFGMRLPGLLPEDSSP